MKTAVWRRKNTIEIIVKVSIYKVTLVAAFVSMSTHPKLALNLIGVRCTHLPTAQ